MWTALRARRLRASVAPMWKSRSTAGRRACGRPERNAGAGGLPSGLRLASRDRRCLPPGPSASTVTDHLLGGTVRLSARASGSSRRRRPQAEAEGTGAGLRTHLQPTKCSSPTSRRKKAVRPRVEPYGRCRRSGRGPCLLRAGYLRRVEAFRGVDFKVPLFVPRQHVERLNTPPGSAFPPLDPDLPSLARCPWW